MPGNYDALILDMLRTMGSRRGEDPSQQITRIPQEDPTQFLSASPPTSPGYASTSAPPPPSIRPDMAAAIQSIYGAPR